MKRPLSRRTFLGGYLATTLLAAGSGPTSIRAQTAQWESAESLWESTVRPFLADELWTPNYAYDAGHLLMIPLHAAFVQPDVPTAWGEQLIAQAERFAADPFVETPDAARLYQLQYTYLLSQMAVLAAHTGAYERLPNGLVNLVGAVHQRLWNELPAWQWGRDPFEGGIRERLLWKLSVEETERTYYRAVIDEELFCLAIGADLVTVGSLGGDEAPQSAREAVAIAEEVFTAHGRHQPDGSWLFQPGVYADHPDYAYAGNNKIVDGMVEQPVPGIACDTSHAHRFARWLRSLRNAAGNDTRHRLYDDALAGLAKQFIDHALVPPSSDFPGFRTTNFLDGQNGVYRWSYETQGEANGYGPYELSGTLLLGWWAFLNVEETRSMYRQIAASFPLPEEVTNLYVGPNTTRKRHPLAALPAFYTNGFAELIARLAGAFTFSL